MLDLADLVRSCAAVLRDSSSREAADGARFSPLPVVGEEEFLFSDPGARHPALAAGEAEGDDSGVHHQGKLSRILSLARKFLGVSYRWAGTTMRGVDCSGLVWRVFSAYGILLPRMADLQFRKGRRVSRLALHPGDLVFFSTYAPGVSHVGIYVGGGSFIHASSSRGVTMSRLSDPYYRQRYVGARRILSLISKRLPDRSRTQKSF